MRYNFTETENVSAKAVCIGRGSAAVLYENRHKKARIGVVVLHSDSSYLFFSTGVELAERGFAVLCGEPQDTPMLMKVQMVDQMVEYVRNLPGIEKVVVFGHSGGATLMTLYQNAAENGIDVFRRDDLIVQFPDRMPGPPGMGGGKPSFTPADGIMLVDPNWGNGAVAMFSLDPAIVDESDPRKLDPELDLFNPANGFVKDASVYSDEFIARFQKAQSDRMNRLIDFALDRMALIKAGKGIYNDDEPMLIPGAANVFFNNKLYAQYPKLLCRTNNAYTLLRKDGERTEEIIHTVRKPQNNRSLTQFYQDGLFVTTVSRFLDSFSVRSSDMHYDESTIYGIDWDSSYCTSTGNIKGIHAPLLLMGMTNGWEFSSVEGILNRATSEDKTVAFVEGATHTFDPERGDDRFGDTVKTTYDFIAEWLNNKF